MHTREPPYTGHASDNNCFMGKTPRSIVNLISNRKTGYNLRGTNILSLPKVTTTRHGLTSFKYFVAKKNGTCCPTIFDPRPAQKNLYDVF